MNLEPAYEAGLANLSSFDQVLVATAHRSASEVALALKRRSADKEAGVTVAQRGTDPGVGKGRIHLESLATVDDLSIKVVVVRGGQRILLGRLN
jgi:hypothetical protein